MVAAAFIVGGATLASGAIGASASKSAGNAQARSAEAAAAESARQYDQTRTDQMPWMDAGKGALNRLQDPTANFTKSPGYDFRLKEGQRGVQQSAAARGGAYSGNAMKALSDYNQGMASNEYGNWWNQQSSLAGVGQATANSLGQLGAQSAANVGNSLMAAGDARASGIMGGANSWSNALNTGVNTYGLYKGGFFKKG